MTEIITLVIGLMINMEDVNNIDSYYKVINNDVVYFIDINRSNKNIIIQYNDKYSWYFDQDIIKSYKPKQKQCIEPIPGLPSICDGVGEARTSKYRRY